MQFVKMHGAGNDFVLLDLYPAGSTASDEEWSALARQMCDRHFGIGADGLLLVLPSDVANARMRMFNPDGSEPASCGNGIRCLGRFLRDRHGLGRDGMKVETGAGVGGIVVHDDGSVTVDMGPPIFAPSDIPVALAGGDAFDVTLSVDGAGLNVSCVSMGNPHAVTFLAGDLDDYALEEIGPKVEHHELFPSRTNFEVCQVVDDRHMRVRVWERGAGITLACGTGACASVVVATRLGKVRPPVSVELPGGMLSIDWREGGNVMMTGPTAYVFSGTWTNSQVPGPRSQEAAGLSSAFDRGLPAVRSVR